MALLYRDSSYASSTPLVYDMHGSLVSDDGPNVVTSVTAGTGITLTGTATDPIINNAGVLALTAGTGINVTGTLANQTITNSGVTSVAGTANQVSASGSTGAVTFSLPSAITTPGSLTTTGNLTVSSGQTLTTPTAIIQSLDSTVSVFRDNTQLVNGAYVNWDSRVKTLYGNCAGRPGAPVAVSWNVSPGLTVVTTASAGGASQGYLRITSSAGQVAGDVLEITVPVTGRNVATTTFATAMMVFSNPQSDSIANNYVAVATDTTLFFTFKIVTGGSLSAGDAFDFVWSLVEYNS